MNVQCTKCSMWYSNVNGLRIHLRYCKKGNDNDTFEEEDNISSGVKDQSSDICFNNRSNHPDSDILYYPTAFDNDCEEYRDIREVMWDNDVDNSFHPSYRKTMAVTKFEIMLNDLLLRHRASLLLYDEIVALVNTYLSSPSFNRYDKIKSRRALLRSTQKSLNTSGLRPKERTVRLHNNSLITVPVFDAKNMIKSLLSDTTLMKESNFAEGYNVLTGELLTDHPANNQYGEVHTGDAWLPARNKYCQDDNDMPVGLIIFADKSHTDLHGSLSLTPFIFTLTLFNRACRNNAKFWRPLGYIPNLSHGKGTSDKTATVDKIQDEHDCVSLILKSLKKINRNNGFDCKVLGKSVRVKVWIHFFIGDTEGNNKMLGQYPGNKEGVKRPYRDCNCTYDMLSHTNPKCTYRTLDDLVIAKRRKREDDDGGKEYYKSISTYDIRNSLLDTNLPLSDSIHGPYKMFPPELLHTSGSGLIMYIFESLRFQIGGGQDREIIDQLHVQISNCIKRQSERDFPRGSMRNGLIDGSKCQSSERKGNLFRLLCIAHTSCGRDVLTRCLRLTPEIKWKQFIEFMKLYLSMEEWFHDANDKDEVKCARKEIAKVLQSLQLFFPRKNNTNGYNLPKMHGMTKMQYYMLLYGSGMNFYGGPGESAHKQFTKIPGQRTQRRVAEFAAQTANQYYDMLVSNLANGECLSEINNCKQRGGDDNNLEDICQSTVDISLKGRYDFIVTEELLVMMETKHRVSVNWSNWSFDDKTAKQSKANRKLHVDLVKMLHKKFQSSIGTVVTGFTKAVIRCDGVETPFYAHPCYRGQEWYDWALVHFQEKNNIGDFIELHYPSRILGYISSNGKQEAVIQCSTKPLNWIKVEKKFIVQFKLGFDFNISFVSVPIESLVHPLCVFADNIKDKCDTFYVVLPKRNWSRYFGDRIKR